MSSETVERFEPLKATAPYATAERLARMHKMPSGEYVRYSDHERIVTGLRSQLPAEMQDCTIIFKECAKGHGWLTATNWVQHDCQICEHERIVKELESRIELLSATPYRTLCSCKTFELNIGGRTDAFYSNGFVHTSEHCPDKPLIDRQTEPKLSDLRSRCCKAMFEIQGQRLACVDCGSGSGYAPNFETFTVKQG